MRSVLATTLILAGACSWHLVSAHPSDDSEQSEGAAGATYFPPPDSQGGWRSVQETEDVRRAAGVDRGKLDEAFDLVKGSSKNGGLLVVRRGWLVYERYFGKGHREATPNLASCGKSVTSIAVGILLAERPELFPDGLEQRIFTPRYLPPEAFPLTDPRKADVKLGQLLAMTAGIRGNNPVYVRGTPSTIDPAGPDGWQAGVDAVALGREDAREVKSRTTTATLWCDPGQGYSYATSSIHLAGLILRHVTGDELHEYVDRRLGTPLGWGVGIRIPRRGSALAYVGRRRHRPAGHRHAALRLPAPP